jgi:hypothetical protein
MLNQNPVSQEARDAAGTSEWGVGGGTQASSSDALFLKADRHH